MESLQTVPGTSATRESAQGNTRPVAAALRMRLWVFGGDEKRLSDLVWSHDQPVTDLIHDVIKNSHGILAGEYPSIAVAHFIDPLHALAAAKSMQQRLLSLQREGPASQVVAAVVIDKPSQREIASGTATTANGTEIGAAMEALLQDANCAQILVSEAIYDATKTVPGFDFSSNPVRAASESGTSEALYELRWTDQSTYGHLRDTSQSSPVNISRERRYTIQSELGRGCMGVVYKAYDEVIGRAVALKTIAVNRNFPNRNELIERLKQEAKAAGSLDHPNIITIYDVGQEEDLLYLSMQLVEGQTLMALINEGNLPPLIELLSYAEQICNAVGYAHQSGVIHRDLKPANFMLTSQGTIKVLDFGIAKLEDATLTQTGMIVGTPTYMAPEQARAQKVDQRSDIFSLGSVFYELFTREKPFRGDITTVLYKLIHEEPPPPSIINPALPMGIDAIIRKALTKDPADRFQTCEEMRDAFRQQAVLLQQASLSKPPAVVQEKARPVTVEDLLAEVRPKRSRSWMWISLATCILLAAGGLSAWAFRFKVRTGYYPPAVTKLLAALKLNKTQTVASNSSTGAPQAPSAALAPSADEHHDSSSAVIGQPAPDAATTAPAGAGVQPVVTQPSQTPATTTEQAIQPGTVSSEGASPQSAPAPVSAASSDNDKPQPNDVNPFEPRKHAVKNAAPPASDAGSKVEGFSRRDVPDLLIRAEDAAGRGDYRLARYEYNIILRLDRQNVAARAGLRHVQEAEQER